MSEHAPAPLGRRPRRQDDALSAREREAVIYKIRTLMQYHGITLAQLRRAPAPAPQAEPAPAPQPVKYRHPVTGEAWDGVGEHPQWLRQALLKEGYRVDELRPQTQAPAQASAPTSLPPTPAPEGAPPANGG